MGITGAEVNICLSGARRVRLYMRLTFAVLELKEGHEKWLVDPPALGDCVRPALLTASRTIKDVIVDGYLDMVIKHLVRH
jgi:hypothetical protein